MDKVEGIAEYTVTFNEIERAEKKRVQANENAAMIHDDAVGRWNFLYDEMMKMVNTYSGSTAFKQSKFGHLFAPAEMNGVQKENQ